MSLPETPLGPLKRRDEEPAFDEPWQAQALGMANVLVAGGVITAASWSTALGEELRKNAAGGAADDTDTYYRSVLAALQKLLYETGAAVREEIDLCEAEWRSAYLNTPHGMPVELDAAQNGDNTRDHD